MTVDEYYRTIDMLLERVDTFVDEARIIALFLDGLNKEIRWGMTTQRYTTLEDALYAAEESEAHIKTMRRHMDRNCPNKGVIKLTTQSEKFDEVKKAPSFPLTALSTPFSSPKLDKEPVLDEQISMSVENIQDDSILPLDFSSTLDTKDSTMLLPTDVNIPNQENSVAISQSLADLDSRSNLFQEGENGKEEDMPIEKIIIEEVPNLVLNDIAKPMATLETSTSNESERMQILFTSKRGVKQAIRRGVTFFLFYIPKHAFNFSLSIENKSFINEVLEFVGVIPKELHERVKAQIEQRSTKMAARANNTSGWEYKWQPREDRELTLLVDDSRSNPFQEGEDDADRSLNVVISAFQIRTLLLYVNLGLIGGEFGNIAFMNIVDPSIGFPETQRTHNLDLHSFRYDQITERSPNSFSAHNV